MICHFCFNNKKDLVIQKPTLIVLHIIFFKLSMSGNYNPQIKYMCVYTCICVNICIRLDNFPLYYLQRNESSS